MPKLIDAIVLVSGKAGQPSKIAAAQLSRATEQSTEHSILIHESHALVADHRMAA
jgi:hypothetical protein